MGEPLKNVHLDSERDGDLFLIWDHTADQPIAVLDSHLVDNAEQYVALIVKSVNMHERLVAALHDCVSSFRILCPNDLAEVTIERARTLLAEAGEG